MIVVFGSIHEDVSVKVDRFPKPGETIRGYDHHYTAGGKGANQAVAAALGGAKVSIIGRVGGKNARRVADDLQEYGVDVRNITSTADSPTGCAYILRDKEGENQIVVVSGANLELTVDHAPDYLFKEPDTILLLQMEVTAEANFEVLKKAKQNGVTTVLNLAPMTEFDIKMLELVDYLLLNDNEANELVSRYLQMPDIVASDRKETLKKLAKMANLTCIVTLGKDGSIAATPLGEVIEALPYPCANVVDSTGAGDCYGGNLAAALDRKMDLASAMRFAGTAASLSCRRLGTQTAYPRLAAVEELITGQSD